MMIISLLFIYKYAYWLPKGISNGYIYAVHRIRLYSPMQHRPYKYKMFHTYPSSSIQYGNGNRLIWYGQIDVPYIVNRYRRCAHKQFAIVIIVCIPWAHIVWELIAANLNLNSINKCAVALSLKCYYYCGLFVWWLYLWIALHSFGQKIYAL